MSFLDSLFETLTGVAETVVNNPIPTILSMFAGMPADIPLDLGLAGMEGAGVGLTASEVAGATVVGAMDPIEAIWQGMEATGAATATGAAAALGFPSTEAWLGTVNPSWLAPVATGAGLVKNIKTAATILSPAASIMSAAAGMESARRMRQIGGAPQVKPPVTMPILGDFSTRLGQQMGFESQAFRRGRAATILTAPSGERLGR